MNKFFKILREDIESDGHPTNEPKNQHELILNIWKDRKKFWPAYRKMIKPEDIESPDLRAVCARMEADYKNNWNFKGIPKEIWEVWLPEVPYEQEKKIE